MKKSICVIFTGGTIGSDHDGKNISLEGSKRQLLIDKYRAAEGNDVKFDIKNPINILSENVQRGDLKKLYECLIDTDISLYDGIIITHGTDSLCFTVNWFSQIFCAVEVPVVFVSALYPLTDARSNGLKNFTGAVSFIEGGGPRGVYCAFANDGENCKIHLGSRLIYPDEINGFYHSALGVHFAEITDGGIVYNSSPLLPSLDSVINDGRRNLPAGLCDEVMLITMRSLLNFAVYDFSKVKPKAVIIELSHSGTVCTVGDELNFNKFADYCALCGVPVIMASVMNSAGVYESMKNVPDSVIYSYDMTLEMTIVKVMSALGNGLAPDAYFDLNDFYEKITLTANS